MAGNEEKKTGYIRAKDVSEVDAERILAFLNNARTAKEIGDAVEIPDERDVGVGVGRNILAARKKLGGFKDLKEIEAVKQVGPERFTEIVKCLGVTENSAAIRRCGPGIRRLLRMKDKDVVQMKKKDEQRLNKRKKQINTELKKAFKRKTPAVDSSISSQESELSLQSEFMKKATIFPHYLYGPVFLDKDIFKPYGIRAIVDFAGNTDDLQNMGISVKSNVQNIFTVTATKKQLADLAAQPATRKIRLPRMFFPTAEEAIPAAEIDQVHAMGSRGNGVIVGILDGTLHVEHHAFRDPANPHDTRVQYLWVQDPDTTAAGALPAGQTPEDFFNDPNHPNSPDFTGLDYGRIYDADAINTALAQPNIYGTGANQIADEPSFWDAEHGTHVAGIAAGSGHRANWADAPVNVGSAPLADIVHVHYRFSTDNVQSGIYEDDIINALDFVIRIADHQGQPVVINNSYGGSTGPHNGNTEFDRLRNAMLDSHFGRSLVYASGNDNNDEGYRAETIQQGNTDVFDMVPHWQTTWEDPPGTFHGWNKFVEIWYNGPELDVEIENGGVSSGWVIAPNDFVGNVNGFDTDISRDVDDISGMKNIRIYIENCFSTWTIRLRNQGASDVQYWAWTGVQSWWAALDGFTIDERTLSDTSCARSLLTVGACAKPAGVNPELIADYSGRGPTMDGRVKPEITAVGGIPSGATAPPNADNAVQSADSRTVGGYVYKQGTSMAAPVVAGAIALLFENDPDLYQEAIKGMLTQTADRTDLDINPDDPAYDPIERNAYGYGRLRMLDPFQHSLPLTDVDVWVRTASDDFGFEPYPGGCFCHAPEIQVFDPANNEVTTLNWAEEHTVKVRVHNLGDTPAVKTRVRIKYTRPWAAPDDWTPCRDAAGNEIEEEVNIPALGYVDLEFGQLWKPEADEIPDGGNDWGNHYCMLVELDHDDDVLQYDDSGASGLDPWMRNIKGTNNVALRNLHIQ